ncbi:MAG: hypothetical protein R2714_16680 [Microthrixaceae bacterium]
MAGHVVGRELDSASIRVSDDEAAVDVRVGDGPEVTVAHLVAELGPQPAVVSASGDLVPDPDRGVVMQPDTTGCARMRQVLDLAVDRSGCLGVGGGDRDAAPGLDVPGMCLGYPRRDGCGVSAVDPPMGDVGIRGFGLAGA